MIVAHEMKHAVKRQNLDFLGGGMVQATGVLLRDVRRNRDIAGQSIYKAGPGQKRQHVRGLVFGAKAPVQRAQFGAAGHQHID
jgi:hypothetical protein